MKLWQTIRIYRPFATNTFQRYLAYRANVVIFVLGDAMLLAVTYFLWNAIYQSSEAAILKGFRFEEMIVYMLLSFVTGTVINDGDVTFSIAHEVKNGSIAMNLIRPINYETRMLFQNFGTIAYNMLILFTLGFSGIAMYMWWQGLSFSPLNFLLYFLSVILSLFITFYFNFAFALLAFKITNMWGLAQIIGAVTQLLSGALIPIVFFPTWFQPIFQLLPFSSMIYTPTMIFLGKLPGDLLWQALLVQVFWLVVLMIIAKVMWKKLIRSLTILGG